jgi:hypothetical protein
VGFEKVAERAIREAMRDGKFDDLPNRGQPLDLEDYFNVPEEWRAAYGLLKSARVLPEEAELLKEIERLEQELQSAAPPSRADSKRMLRDARLRLAVLLDRRRQTTRPG